MNEKETSSSCTELFARVQKEELEKEEEKKDHLIEKEEFPFLETEKLRARVLGQKKETSFSLKERKISSSIGQIQEHKKISQECCSANARYLLYFLEKNPFLYKKRIKNLKLKEHLNVLRQREALSSQMEVFLHALPLEARKIAFKQKKKKEDKPSFEEMSEELIRRREEKLFQLDKIIRYLS